jgi:hypothetical protein
LRGFEKWRPFMQSSGLYTKTKLCQKTISGTYLQNLFKLI